jgi:hypothetical protein
MTHQATGLVLPTENQYYKIKTRFRISPGNGIRKNNEEILLQPADYGGRAV